MDEFQSRSALERVAGSKSTEIILTTIAAYAGGILAPLLPVLATSLAADRQRVRVEAALRSIHETLQFHQEKVKHLNDDQYRIVNEAISAVFSTSSEQKINLLRKAVANASMPLS